MPPEWFRSTPRADAKRTEGVEEVSELTSPIQSGMDLKAYRDLASIDEGCRELGAVLGLSGPVPEDVFIGAMEDSAYARNLLISRSAPAFLKVLLDRPPQRAPDLEPGPKSNGELLAKAARSLWTWARSGMENVSDEAYRRRLDRCAVCPHHAVAPKRAVYALGAAFSSDTQPRMICTLCGCITANKARLATESCPGEDPGRPGLTRWGEPKA
jgi:hypothetical protein